MKKIRHSFNPTRLPRSVTPSQDPIFGSLQPYVIPTFSGKTALALLLRYFRSTRALENKMAEILVPPWMGSWIYMTMQKYSFPTRNYGTGVRGLFLYHQWGFPQHVTEVISFAKKRGLFVIEDCAHAFESYCEDRRLGTFGDAALFSLAKFFPCVAGGALYSADKKIRQFVSNEIRHSPSTLEQEAFKIRAAFDRNPSPAQHILLEQSYAVYDLLGVCRPQALRIVASELARGALLRRKENAMLLKQEFDPRDRFGLWRDSPLPWVVPLFFGNSNLRVAEALQQAGIESGVFHFDVHRNMIDPDYRECIAVPCHSGISSVNIERIIDTVRQAL